ncbi:MAG TPA: DUF3419 family protein [Gemmatimonadaceae bacterium]|nr:DUF3419 family protein [Gemmatimonadaceae bacterium]
MTATLSPAPTARDQTVPFAFPRPVERLALGDAVRARLVFAQVREDPRVELTAIAPRSGDRLVVVSSGGCTALSLLAAGVAEVTGVDLDPGQNHLVELKAAAVRTLERAAAIAFLGGLPQTGAERLATYAGLRPELGDGARAYWDGRRVAVAGGVLSAGASERFIAVVAWLVRHVAPGRRAVERLLACATLDEQRAVFDQMWRGRRWHALFALLLNRWAMSRAYDPAFFAHVGRRDFAEHFRCLAERVLTELPVRDNYFLHQMLTDRYPATVPGGVPPYLSEEGAATIAAGRGRLRLVDGSVATYLRMLPARSIDGLALSNVCEWLSPAEVGALFREVERVAAPGARVVFRNFVGWTELPAGHTRLVEDVALGALIRTDRSMVQSRVVVCRVGDDA